MRPSFHLTVAAVAVREDGRFLLVEERAGGALVLNQPAGHAEAGESLPAACRRETREETAWAFAPEALVGVYQHTPAGARDTYVRFAYCGRLLRELAQPLDAAIVRTLWLSRDELAAEPARLRSPMVLACIDDYLAGRRFPPSLLRRPGPP